jgi:hypothetical protein
MKDKSSYRRVQAAGSASVNEDLKRLPTNKHAVRFPKIVKA